MKGLAETPEETNEQIRKDRAVFELCMKVAALDLLKVIYRRFKIVDIITPEIIIDVSQLTLDSTHHQTYRLRSLISHSGSIEKRHYVAFTWREGEC